MTAELKPVEARTLPPPRSIAPPRLWLRIALPLLVLALGAGGAFLLVATKPRVEAVLPEVLPPLVRVASVQPESLQLTVLAQGTVEPRTQSDLVAEVAGRVTWISPALAAGGFFEAGDPLLRLDARDYEVAVDRASALVARRRSETTLAERNLERRRSLSEQGVVSDAILDDAENAARVARSSLRDARAALVQARLDLERSEVLAPFAGRVRDEQVDVGQFVARGAPLARLYAVDYAEIRLPIPDDELAHLDMPLDYRGGDAAAPGPEVVVRAELAGRQFAWEGRVVRTEGEIDPRSRMVHVVARVDDPYGRGGDSDRPPLPVGLFVDAEILGHHLENVVEIPRAALRPGDRVWVIDADERLRFRSVEIVRMGRDSAVVRGLAAGERVCLSSLAATTDGMLVRTASEGP